MTFTPKRFYCKANNRDGRELGPNVASAAAGRTRHFDL